MQSALSRLALFQFLAVVYAVLCAAAMLKLRFEGPAPQIFSTYVRDWGLLLFLLPAVWLIWANLHMNRPICGTGAVLPVFLSGVALLALLIAVACLGSLSPFIHRSLVKRSVDPAAATAVRSVGR